MPTNTQNKDIRTRGYILRRTNYGEADRILNIITPLGKISAIARAARKEKSKLAGGIEMFCLSDFNIHHKNSDSLGILTSAKLLKYHQNIITDLSRLELASIILKKINSYSEHSDNPDFFKIVDQTFTALDLKINQEIIETWFWFNLAKACGEEINLYRDTNGQKLSENEHYFWHDFDAALEMKGTGNIGADEIKLMRLILSTNLSTIYHIKDIDQLISPILHIARSLSSSQ